MNHFADFKGQVVNALADKSDLSWKSVKLRYENGDRYDGEGDRSRRSVRHGTGVYQYKSDEQRYEGEFLDGEKHGVGTCFFADGGVYHGQWLRGRKHGWGVSAHWSPQGGLWVYDGEYKDGLRSGSGGLTSRGRGALFGNWNRGSLARGVKCQYGGPELQVDVIGVEDRAETSTAESAVETPSCPSRAPVSLGSMPGEWQDKDARLWLRSLGLESGADQDAVCSNGTQLLSVDMVHLLANSHLSAELSEHAQGWRRTVVAAHAALLRGVRDSGRQLKSWGEFQDALPSVKQRFIPSGELKVVDSHRGEYDRNGTRVELCTLPFALPVHVAISKAIREKAQREELASTGKTTVLPEDLVTLTGAMDWVADVEKLVAVKHPRISTLLGIVLGPADASTGSAPAMLAYEAANKAALLFQWVNAPAEDGTKPPLDAEAVLRVCVGICSALSELLSHRLIFGALCSVNVELVPSSAGLEARLKRTGCSWWRWGWRESLRTRDTWKAQQGALSRDDVVRRYATCPVNWMAPEVLRDGTPDEASEVYSFALVVWEMLNRATPFSNLSIAQIVATVGYGGRKLQQTPASVSWSKERTFLHESMSRCSVHAAKSRPRLAAVLNEMSQVLEARCKKKGVFGKLGF
uniref:Protein kinase domain-containing protein n=1 Tax=Noctiluca scintillans TaxID=2966 RepID=A0A7S1A3D6_NOCSC|mmetsp:Transcript_29703/g.78830  ORF Transcript_29703/g.78830 Transcript_29703/m.78830 type:complete len:635 (+) Transcript_29703:57-1961(+)